MNQTTIAVCLIVLAVWVACPGILDKIGSWFAPPKPKENP